MENGGAGGIRTLDTLLTYTHFPGERLRPLGHRSARNPAAAASGIIRVLSSNRTGRRLPIARRARWQGASATELYFVE